MEQFVPDFRDTQVTGAIRRLCIYSGLIIFVPLGTMFFTKKFFFQDLLGYSANDSNLYAAILAVVIVHVILGMFVYVAWREEFPRDGPPPRPAAKAD